MGARRKRLKKLSLQVAEIRENVERSRRPSEIVVPDIIEFCLSPRYLNLPILYPRQATLLKIMFLQTELLTGYDHDVIEEWTSGFALAGPSDDPDQSLHYEGMFGMAPDVLERAALLKADGHRWFPEVVNVGGRRGSKGAMGGVAGSYVTFHLLALGCPQEEFGIAPTKTLVGLVFAGNRKQARDMQWFDIAETIVQAPCFAPYIADVGRDQLTLATPADLDRAGGISEGSIQIQAKEATARAGRGPAAYMAFFDELAHVSVTTAKTSSEDLVENTMPALDQCGPWSFVYAGSSPWQKIGAFYDNYRRGLEVHRTTHEPMDPEVLVCQYPSWELYRDWLLAPHLETIPAAEAARRPGYTVDAAPVLRTFPKLKKAIQAYDAKLKRRERRNQGRFAVEYRAQWATVIDAFLNPAMIAAMFGAHRGQVLDEQTDGQSATRYYAHGDPATKHDNFVWMIVHLEQTDEDDLGHVVVDKIRVWRPGDFPNGHVEYLNVYADILDDFRRFNIVDASFDQYQATMLVEMLGDAVPGLAERRQTHIHEITHTRGSNRAMADIFRPALNNGQIHSYPHELLDKELNFLQDANGKVDHPTTGPVQTNDAAVCLMVLTQRLLELNADHKVHKRMSASGLSGLPWGTPSASDQAILDQLSRGERRDVGIGERRYPGGPKRLPPGC
ncbi:MAG: hypothetical protein KDA98_11995 [Acidimicrobiales bacterium]|nr:hypothetical protein [Acidimicrobiales bacterium]